MRTFLALLTLSAAAFAIPSEDQTKQKTTSLDEQQTVTQCGGFEALQASPYYQSGYGSTCNSGYQSSCNGFQTPPPQAFYPTAPVQYHAQPRIQYQPPRYYQQPVRFSQPSYSTTQQGRWVCGPNGCYLIR